ncbi:MAG: hypothetical protein ACRC7V_07640 [Lachnospiraceae bacterium]
MFFGETIIFKTKAKQNNTYGISLQEVSFIIQHSKILQRISISTSKFYSKKSQGSITVEASIVLSIFLIFIIQISRFLLLYGEYAADLQEVYHHAKENSVTAYLLGESSPNTVVKMKGNARIEIKTYTGYQSGNGINYSNNEKLVYITDYKSVYHTTINCSHLQRSIELLSISEASKKYIACNICITNSSVYLVFVTNQGNRYHSTVSCSSLKRSISKVKLSEIPGVPPCRRCG